MEKGHGDPPREKAKQRGHEAFPDQSAPPATPSLPPRYGSSRGREGVKITEKRRERVLPSFGARPAPGRDRAALAPIVPPGPAPPSPAGAAASGAAPPREGVFPKDGVGWKLMSADGIFKDRGGSFLPGFPRCAER